MSALAKIKDYIKSKYRYEGVYLTSDDYKEILIALEQKDLNDKCIGMFCPNCQTGVHKYLYGGNNKSTLVSYCPFCGKKLEW